METLTKTIRFPQINNMGITVRVYPQGQDFVWIATDDQSSGIDFYLASSETFSDKYAALGNGLTAVDTAFDME